MKKNLVTSVLAFIFTISCSYSLDFEKKELDFSVFQDAPSEIIIPCKDDCGCTVLGPCAICYGGYCIIPNDVDSDHDGYRSKSCHVDNSCAIERNLPQIYFPKQGDDCDDQNNNIHPGAPELCNGIDDDCNDLVDDDPINFGPSTEYPIKLTDGFKVDFCSGSTNLLTVWQEGSPGGKISSGIVDTNGGLFNPLQISEYGKGAKIACASNFGAIVGWSDREFGNFDIMLLKIDPYGNPLSNQEPIHFPDDIFPSMEVSIAYHPHLQMIGVLYLTYDTNVTVTPEFKVFDYYQLREIFSWKRNANFHIPGIQYGYSFMKTNITPFTAMSHDGFLITYNTENGIEFASFICEGSPMNKCYSSPETYSLLTVQANSYRFPDTEWTGSMFLVAYSASNDVSSNFPTRIYFSKLIPAEVKTDQDNKYFEFEGYTLDVKDSDNQDFFGSVSNSNYPSIKWINNPNQSELAMAWTEEPEFGVRIVRFSRFKIIPDPDNDNNPVLKSLIENPIQVSEDEKFAGSPILEYANQPGNEGFIVGWSQKSDLDNGVNIFMRDIKCLQTK